MPDVLIVGGGPAGLILALELGRRGVSCILFEEDADAPSFPKANATTSRTMEHYRRLGFADEIRVLGLPDDYAPDVSYYTRFFTHELARLRWPSRRDALAQRQNDRRWPTPEPLHRGQQMLIERVLRRHVAKWPSIDRRYGWRVERLGQNADGVTAEATEIATGKRAAFSGLFAVGCDGPRSVVRAAMGVRYGGAGAETGEFMGGRMLATYLKAPAMYEIGPERAWQYWALNRDRAGVMVAIDGHAQFVFHAQLPRGISGSQAYARESLAIAAGREFPYEIIAIEEWTAGFTLVAERYRKGRLFIAGDAAHLFTPTAGQGYNTSVDDAANLGWKLAAVCQGWGGPALLDTYEAERQPIAHRNTQFARSIADFYRRLDLPQQLESDDAQGRRARAALGEQLLALSTREFDAPGLHFGINYDGSPVIAREPGDKPADDTWSYIPHARPGARAPHLWIGDEVALFDRFGRDFTLLKLDTKLDTTRLEKAARARSVPLTVLQIEREDLRELYGAALILIRPDHHVAWRGDTTPLDPLSVVDLITGRTG